MGKLIDILFLFVLYTSMALKTEASSDLMKAMFENFKKAMAICKSELNHPEAVNPEIDRFWDPSILVTNRDTGCLLVCLSEKVNLLDEEGHLHHEKTKDYALKHGADDETAQRIIEMFHICKSTEQDQCLRAVSIANCFKKEIAKLNWTPTYEDMTEFVIEM